MPRVLRCVVFAPTAFCIFFFKRKVAYEVRISYWSSDVCSSDLLVAGRDAGARDDALGGQGGALQDVGAADHHVVVGAQPDGEAGGGLDVHLEWSSAASGGLSRSPADHLPWASRIEAELPGLC